MNAWRTLAGLKSVLGLCVLRIGTVLGLQLMTCHENASTRMWIEKRLSLTRARWGCSNHTHSTQPMKKYLLIVVRLQHGYHNQQALVSATTRPLVCNTGVPQQKIKYFFAFQLCQTYGRQCREKDKAMQACNVVFVILSTIRFMLWIMKTGPMFLFSFSFLFFFFFVQDS